MRGARLFGRWFDLVEAPDALRNFVLTELASPARHWHGLLHHGLMLRAVTRAGHDPATTRRLVHAVLFHDIVYCAARSDNEEASAEVAAQWLAGVEVQAVAALILATKRHDLASADPVTRTLLEADLAVLWTPIARLYDAYAAGIRGEYAHVPDDAYCAGRAAVLRRLTDQLSPELDAARRVRLQTNVGREIAALLRAPGPPSPRAPDRR